MPNSNHPSPGESEGGLRAAALAPLPRYPGMNLRRLDSVRRGATWEPLVRKVTSNLGCKSKEAPQGNSKEPKSIPMESKVTPIRFNWDPDFLREL